MSLVLEVEHLTGVAFAAIGPDSDAPDWPPQPDRVFSALVATWAARGGRDDERKALEWLERLDPPEIAASRGRARHVAISFVPPNDPGSGRSGDRTVLPQYRRRQPRRFPAFRPDDPTVRYRWPAVAAEPDVFDALARLASDTAYVGHSASLTRCRFFLDTPASVVADGAEPARRRIYPGRLAELRAAFAAGRRPLREAFVDRRSAVPVERPHTDFAPDWLILEFDEAVQGPPDDRQAARTGLCRGVMPDLRAAPIVAKTIRDALLKGYETAGLGRRIPTVVSGHDPDGAPTRLPHMAVVPLAFAGFPHADGHVLGFAVVPPRGSGLVDDPDFGAALRALVRTGHDPTGIPRPVIRIWRNGPAPGFDIALVPTLEAGRRSLDPVLYTRPARTFATVTPIVLDRHLKEKGAARRDEIVDAVVAACRNIGLPEPEMVETRDGPRRAVVPDKHSAVAGAPSAWPSARGPGWTRWRVPTTLASRALTHAVIRFAEEVEGPVILGAGRFVGLGLCRAYPETDAEAER